MLVATPYINFDVRSGNVVPPRVISEIKKINPVSPLPFIRPKISGDLLVICANERRWWPRRVTIRAGQLHVASAHNHHNHNHHHHQRIRQNRHHRDHGEELDEEDDADAPGSLRIPLRHLSLRAGPLPNSLALCKGQNVILTLQTASERAFDLWVKSIAIELIRQTPLDAVKYLDILTLAECWRKSDEKTTSTTTTTTTTNNSNKKWERRKDCNSNNLDGPEGVQRCSNWAAAAAAATTGKPLVKFPTTGNYECGSSSEPPSPRQRIFQLPRVKLQQEPKQIRVSMQREQQWHAKSADADEVDSSSSSATSPPSDDEQAVVEVLLKKCQNPESYVPVREKLQLFESLCRLGRKVRSTEDVSQKSGAIAAAARTKRARSLHDLSNCESSHIAVREICKYFENKSEEDACKLNNSCSRRLINSDSQLNSSGGSSPRNFFARNNINNASYFS